MRKKFKGLCGLLLLAGLILAACGENPTPTLIPSPTRAVTTLAATTVAPATIVATTVAPTSLAATTAPTTAVLTTVAITTAAATTVAPTVAPATPVAPTTAASASGGQAEIARGLVVFTANGCSSCHGGEKASGGLGPALVGKNYEFSKMIMQIRGGAGIMPAFGPDKIPDSDIKAITSFINSIKP